MSNLPAVSSSLRRFVQLFIRLFWGEKKFKNIVFHALPQPFFYKVLDGVSESYIQLEEIRDIPGTLNGLYLWLCQKQFNKKNFPKGTQR